MKEDLIEYYTNGCMKRRIVYYPDGKTKYIMRYRQNGNKQYEHFYDQQGNFHQEPGLPSYQQWYENGITYNKTYYVHGGGHNICNPSDIYFTRNGKIWSKYYQLNINYYSKLNWMNLIKNI